MPCRVTCRKSRVRRQKWCWLRKREGSGVGFNAKSQGRKDAKERGRERGKEGRREGEHVPATWFFSHALFLSLSLPPSLFPSIPLSLHPPGRAPSASAIQEPPARQATARGTRRTLFLAMSNFRSHASLFAAYLAATFARPFGSHIDSEVFDESDRANRNPKRERGLAHAASLTLRVSMTRAVAKSQARE